MNIEHTALFRELTENGVVVSPSPHADGLEAGGLLEANILPSGCWQLVFPASHIRALAVVERYHLAVINDIDAPSVTADLAPLLA